MRGKEMQLRRRENKYTYSFRVFEMNDQDEIRN